MVAVTAASGCLFGLAYGDALGKPTEFLTVAQIEGRYGPGGPRELEGDPALVTDDTQMALAVGWALHDAATLAAQPAARHAAHREPLPAAAALPAGEQAEAAPRGRGFGRSRNLSALLSTTNVPITVYVQ